MPDRLPGLAADFPKADQAQWRVLVDKVLNGGDYEKRLVSRSSDGLAVEPIYPRRADGGVIAGANAGRPWTIVARSDQPDPVAANRQALADLEGGAGGLCLAFSGSRAARGFGLDVTSVAALDRLMDGVLLDLIAVRIEPAAGGPAIARLVAGLVALRGLEPSKLSIDFGLDPIGVAAGVGAIAGGWQQSAAEIAAIVRELRELRFTGPFIACDLRVAHEAGATEAQELAYGLSLAIAYARALAAHGVPVRDAFSAISWTVAIDADQLLGVAKLRALRRLWARIENASGISHRPIRINAETAWRMLSQRDPAVNMLRSTLATFTAGVGGADSVAVLPHTLPVELPDALARRIARNTQLVLQDEANLWRVADPAAGSGAIEALTDRLCVAAWAEFQTAEREGGIVESLHGGNLQARIAISRTARLQAVATRKTPLTGTSEFPNLGERAAQGIEGMNVARASIHAKQFEPMPAMRLSEPFEALRTAADAQLNETGTRACVFLANLGPVAEHGTRATWTSNLLAAGGIDVVSNSGFTASAEAAAAFAASGASVACLCGTDETYDQLAEATAMGLKAAGASEVLLAGRPGATETALRAAGVDSFVFAGQDTVAFLRRLHARLGITG